MHIVSIKGIIFDQNKVILLKNERDDWELPGGQLEDHEDPKSCLKREVKEELVLDIQVESLIDAYHYNVINDKKE